MDGVADLAGLGEFFVVSAGKAGGIGKAPVQTLGDAGKNGTALGVGFVANSNDIGKYFARFDVVEDGFGLISRNVETDFVHRFDDDGIEFAGFETGAGGFKSVAAKGVEERLGHLAA